MTAATAVRWFGHSGDLGDVIYALPTLKAAGGGILFLYHRDGKTWHGMTPEKAASLRSLLILQPYVTDVVFCPEGRPPDAPDHDLNGFRDHWQPGRNLADMHLATHGFGSELRESAWLAVDRPQHAADVIICRSGRYHSERFPWNRVFEAYASRACFAGTEQEHQDFCESVGRISHVVTRDLLELARVIAGSRLFIGNQSCPAAIAEGLKHPMILEVYSPLANCCFERPGRIDAWDGEGGFELPVV